MLSRILHEDVDAYAARVRTHSPLLRKARSGGLCARAIGTYLEGLRYLTREGVRLMDRAADIAETRGQLELARHFRCKVSEETGHDRWAEADISQLTRLHRIDVPRTGSPALAELLRYLSSEMEAHPEHFLAYVLLVEQVTVLIGPEWLEALERHCGIDRAHMSVVKNHVELDVLHVEEGLSDIDALVPESELNGMRETIRASSRWLDAFFDEIATYQAAA